MIQRNHKLSGAPVQTLCNIYAMHTFADLSYSLILMAMGFIWNWMFWMLLYWS